MRKITGAELPFKFFVTNGIFPIFNVKGGYLKPPIEGPVEPCLLKTFLLIKIKKKKPILEPCVCNLGWHKAKFSCQVLTDAS